MTAIEFENISKQYRLGLVSTRTLSHDIRRFWITNVLGKEDPYLKIGETNDRSTKGSSEYVWALRDINFKVEQGDVVGIIGKNGAGKSTLLKLLSKVTGPTTGTIRAKGRIGSLLEVGTGFHPEMTGRENIFLNGAILGMTKNDIQRKLDEIVDFSGCERYIDTPVKRYSSGMMVRLGFAVAAHLDPEILVVDEVLAVGDAEFQKKAIGKMQDVSKGEGRTVLFVSHNMTSVAKLCKTGVVLENGTTVFCGEIKKSIDFYMDSGLCSGASYVAEYDKSIMVVDARIKNIRGVVTDQFGTSDDIFVEFEMKNDSQSPVRGNFSIQNSMDIMIFVDRFEVKQGRHTYRVKLSSERLLKGSYKINLAMDTYNLAVHDIVYKALKFDIIDLGSQYSINKDLDNGVVATFAKIEEI